MLIYILGFQITSIIHTNVGNAGYILILYWHCLVWVTYKPTSAISITVLHALYISPFHHVSSYFKTHLSPLSAFFPRPSGCAGSWRGFRGLAFHCESLLYPLQAFTLHSLLQNYSYIVSISSSVKMLKAVEISRLKVKISRLKVEISTFLKSKF